MNNKLIYLILTFLYIVTGCNSPAESHIEIEQYYPMRIGNQWEYINSSGTVEKITDTLRVHGKLFYGFSKRSEEPEYWMRETNGKIYYLNLHDSTEFLLFDFTTPTGSSWELPSGYECSFGIGLTLVGKTDTIVTAIGTFYNCHHFRHQTICRDAGMVDTWLVKGIGKVKYTFETFFGIEEYVINSYDILN